MQRRKFTNRSLYGRHEQKGHRWEDYEDYVSELICKGEFVIREDGSRLLSVIQSIRWSSCQPSDVSVLFPL